MKNDKPNDVINQLFEKYNLKEPINIEDLDYVNQREKAIFKNILKKAGRPAWHIILLGIIYSVIRLLTKFGIQATIVKATIALVTTVSIGTFAIYQGTSAIISVVKSKQEKVELNQTGIKPDQPQAIAINPVVSKPKSPEKIIKKKIVPAYKPTVGVPPFKTYRENKRYSSMLAKQFAAKLSKKHFKFVRTPDDIPDYVTHIAQGKLYKTEDTYTLYITASNNHGIRFYVKSYEFKDYTQLDKKLKQAARELTDELF